MPIRWDKWNSAYDPREAELRSMLCEPPSSDEIVERVSHRFEAAMTRIFAADNAARQDLPLADQAPGHTG